MKVTRSAAEFHEFIDNRQHEVVSVTHVSEYLDRISYKRLPGTVEAPYTNSLPVACLVTSYARLRLYEYIEEAEARGLTPLYCDTDSLYYVRRRGQQGVTEGRRLGQMAREHGDRRLRSFISAGTKNYGFVHEMRDAAPPEDRDERAVLKVRGFRLNYDAAQVCSQVVVVLLSLFVYF